MVKIIISNAIYDNYSEIEIDESLAFPFNITIKIVPTEKNKLQHSYLHYPVQIEYDKEKAMDRLYTCLDSLDKKIFYGFVYNEEFEYNIDSELMSVTLNVKHPLFLLETSKRYRIFYKQKLDDIFNAILSPYQNVFTKLKVQYAPIISEDVSKIKLDYITQYEETDLCFFLRLCETYGVRMILYNDVIRLLGSSSPLKLDHIDEIIIPKQARAKWKETISSNACQLKHRNLSCLLKTQTLSTQNMNVSGPDNTIQQGPYWVELFEHDNNMAANKLNIKKKIFENKQNSIEINNKGQKNNYPIFGARCGDVVSLPGSDQKYYIDNVKCVIKGTVKPGGKGSIKELEDYSLQMYGSNTTYPYVIPLNHNKPKIYSLLRALVVKPRLPTQGDSEKIGRIKVQFLWQEEEVSTCWVRLMMPYSGKQHGFFIMPEVGDEVLIGFEGGDIDCPICLGSVYNKNSNELTHLTEAQQMERFFIRTPGNIFFNIDEVPDNDQSFTIGIRENLTITGHLQQGSGDLTLTCSGKSTSSIRIDNSGSISINSDNNVANSSNTITINADNSVSINADNSVNIDSANTNKISMDNSGNTHIESQNSITNQSKSISLLANNKINISSNNSNISLDSDGRISIISAEDIQISSNNVQLSSISVSITGSEELTLKGGNIKIASPGSVSINGSTIRLN